LPINFQAELEKKLDLFGAFRQPQKSSRRHSSSSYSI
jgi:hypothetical protein